jgi:acyl-CoA synthetase (AMP-forming)/AMP-acid ligase II
MQLTLPIHKALKERPDAIATICGARRQTFRQYVGRIARLAGALRALGVRSGDRVAMLALNSDRYMEYVYATWWAGAVIAPLNVRWSQAELIDGLEDSGARVLLVGDGFEAQAAPLRERVASIEAVIHCGDGAVPEGLLGYEALIASASAVEDARRSGDDLAALMYTGGTTGRAKGVMVTHANWFINSIAAVAAAPRPTESIGYVAAPMFHVGGVIYMAQLAVHLATQITMPTFDPEIVLDLIERERIQETFIVPTMVKSLLDSPSFARRDLGSLKCILYGAAPMDEALLDRAMAALPGVQFLQCYGMTECGTIAALPAHWHTPEARASGKLSSAGKFTSCFEGRIVDADGCDLPTGTVGEIALRGPSVAQGYWNKPDETRAALRDGWLHTGDGGYLDADGFLHIVDRVKDMIVSGGENVFSGEVENALLKLDGISMCAVIGVPDPHWGERVHAIIVRRTDSALDEDAVLAHCRTLIAGYKCPRSIEFRGDLPLSAAGKILKSTLREPYWKARKRAIV